MPKVLLLGGLIAFPVAPKGDEDAGLIKEMTMTIS